MTTMNVRVGAETHSALKVIAEREHRTIGDVIADLTRRDQEQRFWDEARVAYTRLRDDPVAWKAWRDETAAWDVTLTDGLAAEPGYDEDDEDDEDDDAGPTPAPAPAR